MGNYINKVLCKYLGHHYPPETKQKVQQWIAEDQNAEEKKAYLYSYWQQLEVSADNTLYDSLEAVRQKAGIGNPTRQYRLRRRFLHVAAVLLPLLLLAGGYFYYNDSFIDNSLTRVTVPYGERQEIILPDGTKVWINAGTTLQYPKTFAGGNRTVKLSGEAYFDVQRDETCPFIVETRKLSVRVLGTRFNVSAYPNDERIVTTLNSGKVAVETADEESFLLEPDEQLTFDKETRKVSVQPVTAEDYCEWKAGNLMFEYVTIDEIAKILERRYNIRVRPEKRLQERPDRYTAKFVHGETLDDVLEVVAGIAQIRYERKGDKVWLNGK